MKVESNESDMYANAKMTYCDASFFIELYHALATVGLRREKDYKNDDLDEILKIWKLERRNSIMQKIAERVFHFNSKTIIAYSRLTELEYMETVTAENLLSLTKQIFFIKTLQTKGRKEIGRVLKDLKKKYNSIDEYVGTTIQTLALNIFEIFDLEDVWSDGYLFYLCKTDLKGFDDYHFNQKLLELSQLQIGLADIMHLVVAKNAECDYFATLDSDFVRVKEEIKEIFGLQVLGTLDEIYDVI